MTELNRRPPELQPVTVPASFVTHYNQLQLENITLKAKVVELEKENARLRDENTRLKAQLTWRPVSELGQLAEDGGNLESELLNAQEHIDNLEFLLKQKNDMISKLEAKAEAYDRLMSGGKKTLKEWASLLGKPIAVDVEGRLLWFPKKPEIWCTTWIWYDNQFAWFGEGLPNGLIAYTGDWQDSLTLPDGWEET